MNEVAEQLASNYSLLNELQVRTNLRNRGEGSPENDAAICRIWSELKKIDSTE